MATEKMRLALHHLAKLTYSQLTELLNIHMNKGAPPDLSVGEPSVDYCMKGSDIAAASYLSEIAYLANPVSTHVNTAETMNQAINPLALISARYTLEAVKLVRMIMSTHLYALVQATDIRAMEISFRSALFDVLRSETISRFLNSSVSTADEDFFQKIIHPLVVLLNTTTGKDCGARFKDVFTKLVGPLFVLLMARTPRVEVSVSAIDAWREVLTAHAQRLFISTRDSYVPGPSAPGASVLGRTSLLYIFVRGELGVRLHWGDPEKDKTEIGTEIGKIFRAFEGPRMAQVLLDVLDRKL
jgi:phenylalanine ammonia-lyase